MRYIFRNRKIRINVSPFGWFSSGSNSFSSTPLPQYTTSNSVAFLFKTPPNRSICFFVAKNAQWCSFRSAEMFIIFIPRYFRLLGKFRNDGLFQGWRHGIFPDSILLMIFWVMISNALFLPVVLPRGKDSVIPSSRRS